LRWKVLPRRVLSGRKEEQHARPSNHGESPPDRIDDATRFVQEQVLPQLQQLDGFKGFIALGDRQSGKLLGVALWESEEVLRATEEAAARARAR
jgi:hypothetical protein